MIDLDRLKKLAEASRPKHGQGLSERAALMRAYRAAMSPDVCLELIAENKRLRARIETLESLPQPYDNTYFLRQGNDLP